MARRCLADDRDRVRGERPGPRGYASPARRAPLVLVGLLSSACAVAAASGSGSLDPILRPGPASRAAFEPGRDAFGFLNLVQAEHPERAGGFSNYCIVMARAAGQFFRFARFAPDRPPLAPARYTELVRQVLAEPSGATPGAAPARVEIPGYADLHAFSTAQEPAIKAAFGSSFWSMVHWRTWRVALPLGARHQYGVARELRAEVDAGWPAPVMITNFPDQDLLNHAVLVYDYRVRRDVVEFLAYDPNDPDNPLALTFQPATRGFWVETLPYSPPGRVRAFRLFASPLL
jgi:hypothetical protein